MTKRKGLLPCPHCGGKAGLYQTYESSWCVQCDSCGATTLKGTEEEVVEKWNARETQLITCCKCHGKGTYKVPIYDDMRGIFDIDYWQKNECELCHGTGKITLQFYEEIQRKARGEDK